MNVAGRWFTRCVFVFALVVAGACSSHERPAEPEKAGTASSPDKPVAVTFTDVTERAGLRFKHTNGAFGKKYLPETMGAGAAFLDIDQDGWQDLFLVNSTHWPGQSAPPAYSALYRNNGDGSFADVTDAAGLKIELYGMGAAAGDYDNDGLIDLYVTGLGKSRLFRNLGGAKFADVTERAGVGTEGFSTSAVWMDYDRDGRLDLY
jgi:hypothetical protein